MDTKEIIWNNVKALMVKKYGKENLYKTSTDSNKTISLGALQRIKERETAVGVDVLDKIARFFEVQTWHLLLPNLDVDNPPVILISEVEQRFYKNMKAISKELQKEGSKQ